jgi:hypothetical protein
LNGMMRRRPATTHISSDPVTFTTPALRNQITPDVNRAGASTSLSWRTLRDRGSELRSAGASLDERRIVSASPASLKTKSSRGCNSGHTARGDAPRRSSSPQARRRTSASEQKPHARISAIDMGKGRRRSARRWRGTSYLHHRRRCSRPLARSESKPHRSGLIVLLHLLACGYLHRHRGRACPRAQSAPCGVTRGALKRRRRRRPSAL